MAKLRHSAPLLPGLTAPCSQAVIFEGFDKACPKLRSLLDNMKTLDAPRSVASGPAAIYVENRRSPLNDLHRYWSKKPYDAVRSYILHFTDPGDIVLDPFCGSGGVGIACLTTGRSAVLVDASPAATHIAAGYMPTLADNGLGRLREHVETLQERTEDLWTFKANASVFRINGILYSESFQCDKCLTWNLVATDVPDGESDGGECPCGHQTSLRSIKTRFRGPQPVRLYASCLTERKKKEVTPTSDTVVWKAMMSHLNQFSSNPPPEQFLASPIAEELLDLGGRLRSTNTLRVRDLYGPLGLHFLHRATGYITSLVGETKELKQALLFLLTASSLNFSRMYQARRSGGGIAGATFYVPPVFRQINPADSFAAKLSTLAQVQQDLGAKHHPDTRIVITCEDAGELNLPPASIDYVFTDPPYADTMPYGALNCVWEAVLGATPAWRAIEARESRWHPQMLRSMRVCFRALKPGGWLSLCYHDTSEGTWEDVQDIMAEAGFVCEVRSDSTSIETGQKAFQQIHGTQVTKRDLVINFRKPQLGELGRSGVVIPADADAKTFRELATQVVRDYLQTSPGRTKDRIYDDLVSRMIRAGQMQAHNFDEILREVAEEAKDAVGSGRWYLRETEESVLDAAETAKEDAAAETITKLINKTTAKTYEGGVHYSDLFEHYLYTVKDKPRRELAEWLPDYFYKTEDGTWRVPADDEERELKAKARASGTNRRVKRFASMLEAGVAIPAKKVPTCASLAEWIRHAKRAGLYEIGKLLYERGGLDMDRLSEQVQAEVEEDYQVCVRALQRAAGGGVDTGNKRGRRKKDQSDK